MQKNEDIDAELERLRTVVRCVSFLNYKVWNGDYSHLIVDLLLSLQERIHLLTPEDQCIVHLVRFLQIVKYSHEFLD